MLASSGIVIPVEVFVALLSIIVAGLISALAYLFTKSVELGNVVATLQERTVDHDDRLANLEGRHYHERSTDKTT